MRIDELAASILLPATYRLTGRGHMRMLREARSWERLDEEQLLDLQLRRLRRLVEHAALSVPFYQSRFKEIGLEPGDVRSLDDLSKIPVLTRAEAQENTDQLISTRFVKEDLNTSTTGGSTGEPVEFYQDVAYCQWGSAVFLRNLEWTGFKLGERQIWLFGTSSPNAVPITARLKLLMHRRWILTVNDLSEASTSKWAEAISSFRPRLLYGYPSALSHLGMYVEQHGVDVSSVRHIVTTSEQRLPSYEEGIARAFPSSRLFEQYGGRELYSIAAGCRCGSMHVNSALNLVEFEDLTPEASATGSKDLVVTPLLNYGMPLIRYAIGDCGMPDTGRCECGKILPRVKQLSGRTADVLVTSKGVMLAGLTLGQYARRVPGVARFQYRQTAPDVIELLVVKGTRFTDESARMLDGIGEEIVRDYGAKVTVPIKYVDDIPRTPQGKHKFIISEISGGQSL